MDKYAGNPTIHRKRHTKNQPHGPISRIPFNWPFFTPIDLASNTTQMLVPTTINKSIASIIASFFHILLVLYGERINPMG